MAAPLLDRRVYVGVLSPFIRDMNGEILPQTRVWRGLWSSTQDTGTVDLEQLFGSIILTQKRFVIRFDIYLLRLGPLRLEIIDEYGRLFNVDSVDELEAVGQRRRFIAIQGVSTNDYVDPASLVFGVPIDAPPVRQPVPEPEEG